MGFLVKKGRTNRKDNCGPREPTSKHKRGRVFQRKSRWEEGGKRDHWRNVRPKTNGWVKKRGGVLKTDRRYRKRGELLIRRGWDREFQGDKGRVFLISGKFDKNGKKLLYGLKKKTG